MDTRTLLAIADVGPAYYLSESRVFVSGVQLYPNKDCQNSATTTLQRQQYMYLHTNGLVVPMSV